MAIYQLVFSLAYGDAIGNEVLAIDETLKELNYDTAIYACVIDKRLESRAQYLGSMQLKPEDIVIYHKASGGPLSDTFKDLKCKKIMLYHNITPASFFKPYSKYKAKRLEQGRLQLRKLIGHVDYCLADSQYNKEELIEYGFSQEKVDVLPIIMDMQDYAQAPNEELIKQYNDGRTNILFTGRIAPNKKHEDLIKVFYYYKNYVDPKARLFLVGSYNGTEKYYAKLKGFVADLKLEDVYFTGHLPFKDILAYYRLADVFLCMSEHEGFCVPLLESMYFQVPIVAYASSAVPYTLNGSGILLEEKDFIGFTDAIKRLLSDEVYKAEIIATQNKVLKGYDRIITKEQFKRYITRFIKECEEK